MIDTEIEKMTQRSHILAFTEGLRYELLEMDAAPVDIHLSVLEILDKVVLPFDISGFDGQVLDLKPLLERISGEEVEEDYIEAEDWYFDSSQDSTLHLHSRGITSRLRNRRLTNASIGSRSEVYIVNSPIPPSTAVRQERPVLLYLNKRIKRENDASSLFTGVQQHLTARGYQETMKVQKKSIKARSSKYNLTVDDIHLQSSLNSGRFIRLEAEMAASATVDDLQGLSAGIYRVFLENGLVINPVYQSKAQFII